MVDNIKLYRFNIKTGGINPFEFCMSKNIIGGGWSVGDEMFDSLGDYQIRARAKGYGRGCYVMTNALNRMNINDLIWTRNPSKGDYYLCRVTGPWQYISKGEYGEADIVNFVPCEITHIGKLDKVPTKVINSFRAPLTVLRIYEDVAIEVSKSIYNKAVKKNFYTVSKLSNDDKLNLLSPDDTEELVSLYLQVEKGYYIYTSTNKKDTKRYEFAMIHKDTKTICYTQVKTGHSWVDGAKYAYDVEDGSKVYLYFSNQNYKNCNDRIVGISRDELLSFIENHFDLLPKRIKLWFEQ